MTKPVDATLRAEKEDAVRASSLSVGHLSVSAAGRITEVNDVAAHLLNERADVLVGRPLRDLRGGAWNVEFDRACQDVMRTRQPASVDILVPESGLWLELRAQPTGDGGLCCYLLNITSRKASEERARDDAELRLLSGRVAETLESSVDVAVNVARLAQLVVPDLGSWSIVTLPDERGLLVDDHCWHVDPAKREYVERFAHARGQAMDGTLLQEHIESRSPLGLMSGAHEAIRARLKNPIARDRLKALAPEAACVLPMVARGRNVGVLCVYSDTAWTEHHFDVAKDVAARAALALDNSLAYARARSAQQDAETARGAAEAAGQRLSLLVQVSEALSGAPDADEAMGRLARLVVPRLGDWSLVTVLDEAQGLRDVAVAHRDEARNREVSAYAARRGLMQTQDTPLAVALRTGQPFVVAKADEVSIRAQQPDAAMATLRQGLAPHGVAVIPLIANGRAFGALTLVTTHERGGHTTEELSAALEVAQRAGPVLAAARSAQRARTLAESVQRSMLTVPPTQNGLEISVRYRPAQIDNEVGGDWYDHFELPNGSTVLTIGDVMGHDTAAIAAMAQMRTLMRASAWSGRHTPAGVLADTDSASRALGPGAFATAITGELDRPAPDGSVVLRWSNAGHPPPAVIGADGAVSYLRTPVVDVPLGVVPSAVRHDHTMTLQPGSTLLLFTDGLIERRDRDVDNQLGVLQRVLADAHGAVLSTTLDDTLTRMTTTEGHQDDIAIVAVRIALPHPPSTASTPARVYDDVVSAAHTLQAELPADLTAPSVARDLLARYAEDLTPDTLADAGLLASELISNALRYGRPPFSLHVELTRAQLRVGVADLGARRPDLPDHPPPNDQPTGRGLIILDAIAQDWGVTTSAANDGKTVWFTLPADAIGATVS